MTALDVLWAAATVLFVGGILALGVGAWRLRQLRAEWEGWLGSFVKIDMGVNGTITGPADELRHFMVRRRPFDWSRHEGL